MSAAKTPQLQNDTRNATGQSGTVAAPSERTRPKNDTRRRFIKTPVANLYKGPLGNYFMHAKIRGRLIRKCLDTSSFEIAKVKLTRLHAEETARAKNSRELGRLGNNTFEEIAAEFLRADAASVKSKPRTKIWHVDLVRMIKATWPGLDKTRLDAITAGECAEWAANVCNEYSAPRYNSAVDLIKKLFAMAVARGIRLDNPAEKLPKATVRQRELHLPSQEQFARLLARLDGTGYRRGAALTVRVLAYSGLRLNEAAQLTPSMIDFERKEIRLPGSICKNSKERRVPIIADLEPLLRKLCAEYTTGKFLPVSNPIASLALACKEAGVPRITNHDLRHLFATKCLESGVDVKTVAVWLGHQDGGALLLKTYAHLRSEHSQAMAAKVRFG